MPESLARQASREFRVDEERPRHGVVLLALHGDVDLHVVDELRGRMEAASLAGASTLVVDLDEATFLDSSVLGVLVGTSKRVRARGGELRLVVPRADLRRIFEITLLDRVLPIVDTRSEALASPRARSGD